MSDYREVNRANWDERVPAHVASPSYHVDDFLSDPSYLSEVVRFDQPVSATSVGSAAYTCSATSGPTPCRWRGSARG